MVANPPASMPYLYYEDVASALEWLAQAFGFRERMRIPGPGDKIRQTESTRNPCETAPMTAISGARPRVQQRCSKAKEWKDVDEGSVTDHDLCARDHRRCKPG